MSDEETDDLMAVVCTSTAANPFDDAMLEQLLTSSRTSNGARGISGMLLHRGGRFIQIVEGPESEIHALLDAIRGEDRHGGVRIMMEDHGRPRRFPDWTMGYQAWDAAAEGMPEGFRTTSDELDDGTEDATMRAVRELSQSFRRSSDVLFMER